MRASAVMSLWDKETDPFLAVAQRSCSWVCTDVGRSPTSPTSFVRSDTLKMPATSTLACVAVRLGSDDLETLICGAHRCRAARHAASRLCPAAELATLSRGGPRDRHGGRADCRARHQAGNDARWHTHTLAEDLSIGKADEDDVYAAMDWLLERQDAIERKLAARHLKPGGLVLYDLSSSYFEGKCCPLAALGKNRDGKKGKLQVNYGLLTDRRGCPVAISVFSGDTGDATTFLPQVRKLRDAFGLEQMVLVGDRGMISSASIAQLRAEDFGWITALKSGQIHTLIDDGQLQLGLFDQRNLFELSHPDFPGERLVACRNPELAKLRAHKREALITATTEELEKVRNMVARGKLKGSGKIGVRVGKVVNKYKMAKHFELIITDHSFKFSLQDRKSTRLNSSH